MDHEIESPSPRRYAWPWFVLAAVVAGAVLAFLWMSVAVRRTRESRASSPSSSTNHATPVSTNDALAAYRETLTGGNVAAGRKVFFEKPEANCGKCHKVGGQGGDTGPALDGIGSKQTREYILESMIWPNLRTIEGYESIILLLKNGTGCTGLLKSENESELVVRTEDGLVTVKKIDVQVRQKGLSPMPEGFGQIISKQDLRDLIEFVASLKTNSPGLHPATR